MVIKVKRKPIRKIVELIVTLFGWLYLFGVVFVMINSFTWKVEFQFTMLTLSNVHSILLFTIVSVVCSLIVILLWVTYNKKKYGHLNRRKFPPDTSLEQLSQYYDLPIEEVRGIQQQKIVIR